MTPLPRPGSTAGQSSRHNNSVMVVRHRAEDAAALTWGQGVSEAYLVDAQAGSLWSGPQPRRTPREPRGRTTPGLSGPQRTADRNARRGDGLIRTRLTEPGRPYPLASPATTCSGVTSGTRCHDLPEIFWPRVWEHSYDGTAEERADEAARALGSRTFPARAGICGDCAARRPPLVRHRRPDRLHRHGPRAPTAGDGVRSARPSRYKMDILPFIVSLAALVGYIVVYLVPLRNKPDQSTAST
jgi:hypothetical protein